RAQRDRPVVPGSTGGGPGGGAGQARARGEVRGLVPRYARHGARLGDVARGGGRAAWRAGRALPVRGGRRRARGAGAARGRDGPAQRHLPGAAAARRAGGALPRLGRLRRPAAEPADVPQGPAVQDLRDHGRGRADHLQRAGRGRGAGRAVGRRGGHPARGCGRARGGDPRPARGSRAAARHGARRARVRPARAPAAGAGPADGGSARRSGPRGARGMVRGAGRAPRPRRPASRDHGNGNGMSVSRAEVVKRLSDRTAVAGVVGLGYVGLPLAVELARSGYRTLGFDVNERVVEGVNAGRSHVQDVPGDVLRALVGEGLLAATRDMARLAECDAISICVPTPLNKINDPDLSYVLAAGRAIARTLRPGQLVILESTTYPGTTREV